MAHLRVWTFRPPRDREAEFAAAYASDGAWARLFRTADGFMETRLLRPAEPGGWWMTIDRWESEIAFIAFQRERGEDYRELDAELEGCAGEEVFVGAFDE